MTIELNTCLCLCELWEIGRELWPQCLISQVVLDGVWQYEVTVRTPVRLLAHEKAQCWNQRPRQRHRETKNDADGKTMRAVAFRIFAPAGAGI